MIIATSQQVRLPIPNNDDALTGHGVTGLLRTLAAGTSPGVERGVSGTGDDPMIGGDSR